MVVNTGAGATSSARVRGCGSGAQLHPRGGAAAPGSAGGIEVGGPTRTRAWCRPATPHDPRGHPDRGLRTAPPRHTGGLQRLASVPIGVAVDTGHRLAILNSVRWADLDHENLLVWNPPGTPYTDLLLTLTAKHDVHLTAVRSTVVGGHGLPDVAQGRGIALVPAFQPTTAGVRVVPLDSTATLPLLAAWNEPVGALTHSERKHLQSLLAEAGNARRAAP